MASRAYSSGRNRILYEIIATPSIIHLIHFSTMQPYHGRTVKLLSILDQSQLGNSMGIGMDVCSGTLGLKGERGN